jgi:hypothetical protein
MIAATILKYQKDWLYRVANDLSVVRNNFKTAVLAGDKLEIVKYTAIESELMRVESHLKTMINIMVGD